VAAVVRFVNTASTSGGDGTTNATTGANRAYPTLSSWSTAEATNLITDGDTHEVRCTGGADTVGSNHTAWTTDDTNSLLINPNSGEEHAGIFDTGKYHITQSGNYGTAIGRTNEQIEVNTMQVHVTGNFTIGIAIGSTASATQTGTIANCIVKGGGSDKGSCIRRVVGGPAVIYNNVVYEARRGIQSNFASTAANNVIAIYNNTIDSISTTNTGIGLHLDVSGANHHVKNNLITNCTTDYARDATPVEAATATNITSDATSPDGTTFQNKTITYTDAAGDDYSTNDTDVVGVGTDLSADSIFAFSTDILGITRSAWDVGAFEDQGVVAGRIMSSLVNSGGLAGAGGIAGASGGLAG